VLDRLVRRVPERLVPYCSGVIFEQHDAQVATLMPQPEQSIVAVPPPGNGSGMWAGAPSAARGNGEIYLAYRLRRPIGQGRGYAVVVARSSDGECFEPVLTIGKDELDTESLERPDLVVTPDGTWRLYLSCATAGTKHWRIEVLEAAHPAEFDARQSRVVLPGDARTGIKDPVIVHDGAQWHLWASAHPLTDPDATDRMATEYATSTDGLRWAWRGTALSPRPAGWDSRGVRVSAVRMTAGSVIAYYDGRASAAENYEERTGVATGEQPGALTANGEIAQSPFGSGGLRYLSILPLGEAGERYYYEMTRPDGAHELRTELRPAKLCAGSD
jgi:hypothetical protein